MRSLLKEFGELSSLKPNLAKSEVVYAGANSQVKVEICAILGKEDKSLPLKYLGVPLINTRLMHSDFQSIIDKIKKKI